MAVWEVNHRGTYSRLADPNFNDFRDRNHTFTAMAKFTDWVTSVSGTAEPMRATVATVSQDFFKVIGIQPSLGRGDHTGRCDALALRRVAIVSHRYWVQTLGSSTSLSDVPPAHRNRVYTSWA